MHIRQRLSFALSILVALIFTFSPAIQPIGYALADQLDTMTREAASIQTKASESSEESDGGGGVPDNAIESFPEQENRVASSDVLSFLYIDYYITISIK